MSNRIWEHLSHQDLVEQFKQNCIRFAELEVLLENEQDDEVVEEFEIVDDCIAQMQDELLYRITNM